MKRNQNILIFNSFWNCSEYIYSRPQRLTILATTEKI